MPSVSPSIILPLALLEPLLPLPTSMNSHLPPMPLLPYCATLSLRGRDLEQGVRVGVPVSHCLTLTTSVVFSAVAAAPDPSTSVATISAPVSPASTLASPTIVSSAPPTTASAQPAVSPPSSAASSAADTLAQPATALLVSPSVSVNVTPNANVSVTHNTSNDCTVVTSRHQHHCPRRSRPQT
ncbi:hypothetical protein F5148DRAFT_1147103 [Russula earlei]|uniref:Uncharacterized protein n=1 Tax=Russula earlei TaxID=71964 RepID=A0ACC0UIU2_9AGAM|nr:hypothetical protein F5148DRAFT_1147103 [Russula earlei]